MEFVASKYDKDNDPYMPKVGSEFSGKIILKAEPIEASALMRMVMSGKEPEPFENSSTVLIGNHPERPMLKYLIWVK